MAFLSKFNFPALRPSPERQTPGLRTLVPAPLAGRLSEGWRVLALPLGVAVGVHVLWVLVASVGESKRAPARVLASGDDTPELLRFSRRSAQAATAIKAPNLSLVPLPLDNSLPPPPPDLAFLGTAVGPSGPGKPDLAGATAKRPAAASPVSAAARGDLLAAERSSLEGLPSDPLVALRLALALSDNRAAPPPTAEGGNGGSGPGPAGAVGGSSGGADKPSAGSSAPAAGASGAAAAAIARRHVKLSVTTERPFLLLWQQARPLSPRPEALADLPEGVDVRGLPVSAVRRLGLQQPQGLSFSLSRGLLLFWVDGDDLWLIQQKA